MIHQIDIEGRDKVDKAILRLQTYEPEEGYYLCFSGGKDSVVIKALADMAGVKYDAHYSATGLEPPKLIRFIKDKHPDVEWDIPRYKDGRRKTMWSLIPEKLMPPTMIVRYCCKELKEEGGIGRFVITGVRWAESTRRKRSRHLVEEMNKSGKQVFSTDNDDEAPMFKFCQQNHKRILNPIVDWSDAEVWEFIHEYKVPYCCLYDEGRKRLGCIGCPMGDNAKELEQYPRYKNLYLMAFEKMLQERKKRGLETEWETAGEVYQWWVSSKGVIKTDPSQISLDEIIE